MPALRAVHAATGCTRVALVVTGRSVRAVDAHELRRHITPEAEFRDLMRGEPNVLDDALRVFAECADGLFNVPRSDVSVLEKATEAVLTAKVHVPVPSGLNVTR